MKTEAREVRIGAGRQTLPSPMTVGQARRYGDMNIPVDLRRAGFKTVVFVSDPAMNDGYFYRISYGK